jgi:hypothetical protein
MKLITIHKSICIISLLHLFANVVHSAEPSTSVTLSGATEQPSSIHITKRIISSATETTPENVSFFFVFFKSNKQYTDIKTTNRLIVLLTQAIQPPLMT